MSEPIYDALAKAKSFGASFVRPQYPDEDIKLLQEANDASAAAAGAGAAAPQLALGQPGGPPASTSGAHSAIATQPAGGAAASAAAAAAGAGGAGLGEHYNPVGPSRCRLDPPTTRRTSWA